MVRRRRYYGRAGAFRPKPYGHEYRVIGSSALTSNSTLNEWIFEQNQRAIAFLNSGSLSNLLPYYATIREAIDLYHHDSCIWMLDKFNIERAPS
jgi:hypothetical protein